ncbi:winged helix-turn-helix domain-containing protein [Microlunatus sp. GCM10028923]|uniref:winged helix-turn-helix domain-containing protein n=1 Tax=Microlunatus sp. GCM10028923 TaxID=3273400 RepID=UPI003615358D
MRWHSTARDRSALLEFNHFRRAIRVVVIDQGLQLTRADGARLLQHGLELRPFRGAAAALLGLVADEPAAVLVPAKLAEVDLLAFVEAVSTCTEIPVIIGVDADPSTFDLAYEALEKGARGLIMVPFEPDQLLGALHNVGLRAEDVPPSPVSHGPIHLDPATHEARVQTTEVALTPREFEALRYLITEAPRVVGFAELLTACGVAASNNVLIRAQRLAVRIRHKLDAAAGGVGPSWLVTVRGVGYRLRNPD